MYYIKIHKIYFFKQNSFLFKPRPHIRHKHRVDTRCISDGYKKGQTCFDFLSLNLWRLTRALDNYARIFPSNLRPFPYMICDVQSGPILFMTCNQVQYYLWHAIRSNITLPKNSQPSFPFSHLFAFLNYLTGSNIPYQGDHKFTEQQTTVSDGTQNRQRWHTECQNSLTVQRRLLPRCIH